MAYTDTMRLDQRPVLALLAASVLVHAGVLSLVYHRTGGLDRLAFSSPDCGEYYRIAQNIVAHGAFSASLAQSYQPDTWRTPGYPLFLAMGMFLFGQSPVVLVILQQLLAIVNVILFAQVVQSTLGRRRTLLAGLVFLVEPYHHLYALWLMPTTLFATLLLLTWSSWKKAADSRGFTWWAMTGLSSGILVLVRPIGLLVPVAILFGILIRRADARRTAMSLLSVMAVYAVSTMLVLGAWMTRNKVVADHFALSAQGGVVLAYFKATEVVLWRLDRTSDRYLETSLNPDHADQPHVVWEDIDTRLRNEFSDSSDEQLSELRWPNLAQGNKTTLDSFAISKALRNIGWSYLSESPWHTISCCLTRFGTILTFPLNLAIKPPRGIEMNTGVLQHSVIGGAYLILCFGALVRLFRRRYAFVQIYFPLVCTMALLLATTPQIDPRFRVPMIPLLIFVALLPRTGSQAKP